MPNRSRVHTPDADIDVLCLAPRHCSREAFFTSFCEILRNHAEIDELFPVPEAYTPVSCCWVVLACAAAGPRGAGAGPRGAGDGCFWLVARISRNRKYLGGTQVGEQLLRVTCPSGTVFSVPRIQSAWKSLSRRERQDLEFYAAKHASSLASTTLGGPHVHECVGVPVPASLARRSVSSAGLLGLVCSAVPLRAPPKVCLSRSRWKVCFAL